MRKIAALYINEMIKNTKRVSIIVILAIMIVGMVGIGALIKYQDIRNTKEQAQNQQGMSGEWQKENMKQQLTSAKTQLEDIQKNEKTAAGDKLASLKIQEEQAQSQVDRYQYAVDHDINADASSYLAKALTDLYQYKSELSQLKEVPEQARSENQKKQVSQYSGYVTRLQNILDNKNFSDYLAYSDDKIDNTEEYTAEEKEVYRQANALREKYNVTGIPTGTAAYIGSDPKETLVQNIENGRISLLSGVDSQTNKPLTPEKRDKITNDDAVYLYELSHNVKLQNSTADFRSEAAESMMSIGTLMLLILVVILAGGSVSQEMATGSIKSLIIAPVKRWKIFTAKLLSLLSIVVIGTLVVYLITVVMFGFLYGFGNGDPYLYASGGAAGSMSFYLYYLAKAFVNLIVIAVYLMFALMLSVITRNTAVSVGVGIGIYFGGSIIQQIFQHLNGEWIKFVPFTNFDLNSKIFPYASIESALSSGVSASSSSAVNTTAGFALCYIAVLLLLMGYTAYDSFCRRDIR